MKLIIENQSGSTVTYVGGAVSVPSMSNVTVPLEYMYPCSRDPQLISDCNSGVVNLNDEVNDYAGKNAIDYLNDIALSLGGAVVGYAGTAAPSFQITIGGKDANGLSVPARMNQFADLATNFRNSYKNITGNSTTVIKSASGTLHGILIGNNSTGGTATFYDDTAATGSSFAMIQFGSPTGGLLSTSGVPSSVFLGPLGSEFLNGLTIKTLGSSSNNITVFYQ